jgi:hypothetical protein
MVHEKRKMATDSIDPEITTAKKNHGLLEKDNRKRR